MGGVDETLNGEDDLAILYSVTGLETGNSPIVRLDHREKGILLSDAACKGDKGDAKDPDRHGAKTQLTLRGATEG